MNKMLVLLYTGAACLGGAGVAWGQTSTQATIRMSWATCDPQNVDALFIGPTPYTLVVSAADFAPGVTADDHLGTETLLAIVPTAGSDFPDAWRFDEPGGCQTGTQLFCTSAGMGKTCPGINPASSWFSLYGFDPATNQAWLRLARAYFEVYSPEANRRYVLWQVSFDMSYAVVGAGQLGMTCGGADTQVRIVCAQALLYTARGDAVPFQTAPSDLDHVTWNMGPPVQTVSATWGRLKGLYR